MSREIFLVFFAIFWGTAANAQPRWKAFHYPFVFDSPKILVRLVWSMLVLNILPISLFVFVLLRLPESMPGQIDTLSVLRGVVPAFAPFGVYRIWLSGIEGVPSMFYHDKAYIEAHRVLAKAPEPNREELKIDHGRWWANLLFGLLYVSLAFVW